MIFGSSPLESLGVAAGNEIVAIEGPQRFRDHLRIFLDGNGVRYFDFGLTIKQYEKSQARSTSRF